MEHIARIINADEFESFGITQVEPGVSKIAGKLKKVGSVVAHAYQFDAETFTPDTAKAWLKSKRIETVEFLEAFELQEIKAGARHSKSDMAMINEVHSHAKTIQKHMKALGAYKSEDVPDEWLEDLKTVSKGN